MDLKYQSYILIVKKKEWLTMINTNIYYGTGEYTVLAIGGLIMFLASIVILVTDHVDNCNLQKIGIDEPMPRTFSSPFIVTLIVSIIFLVVGADESLSARKYSDENIITDITNKFADDTVDVIPNADNIYDSGKIHTTSNGNWSYIVDYEKDVITLYPDGNSEEFVKVIVR